MARRKHRKHHRTAAQKRATRELIAFNRKHHRKARHRRSR
jgi:hypothetical protein